MPIYYLGQPWLHWPTMRLLVFGILIMDLGFGEDSFETGRRNSAWAALVQSVVAAIIIVLVTGWVFYNGNYTSLASAAVDCPIGLLQRSQQPM